MMCARVPSSIRTTTVRAWPHGLDRAEVKARRSTERATPANDDLVRVIGVAFVADVVSLAKVRAVARHDSKPGDRERTTELRLTAQALLGTLIPYPLLHAQEA